MILDIINIACLVFTVAGAAILGIQGDKLRGWLIYVIAATLGVIYFIFTMNPVQIALWSFFFVNDLIAIRRIKKTQRHGKKINEGDKDND